MARQSTTPATATSAESTIAHDFSATPLPAVTEHITLQILLKGRMLQRVHQDKYAAAQFNPGMQGNARFSPLRNEQGEMIPTLYAGTTFSCALMETVFHDVPHTAGFKSFDKRKLAGHVHSEVEVTSDLQLVDLGSVALRKLGVLRKRLIDKRGTDFSL
jgi:hypothetical protein